jgi:hypothetical protein
MYSYKRRRLLSRGEKAMEKIELLIEAAENIEDDFEECPLSSEDEDK